MVGGGLDRRDTGVTSGGGWVKISIFSVTSFMDDPLLSHSAS